MLLIKEDHGPLQFCFVLVSSVRTFRLETFEAPASCDPLISDRESLSWIQVGLTGIDSVGFTTAM